MEKKNNIGLVAVLVLIIVLLVGYIIYMNVSDNSTKVENNSPVVEDEKNELTDVESDDNESHYVALKIEDKNCVNASNLTYDLYSGDAGVTVNVEDDGVLLQLSRSANLALTNKDEYQSYKINNFNQKIIDVMVGTIGQDIAGTHIIFLMEDGSLEYIPLYKALQENNVKSYGKINGVSEIVKLYSAGVKIIDSPVGGGMTILAQKEDGNFFDLSKIINN